MSATADAPTDLVGDGGVVKTVLAAGAGARPPRGATVEVHYEGRLVETGALFDSSRARGKPFRFTLGEGKVIGGWEVGVSSMQVGERCELTCLPQYAYGAKGIPPLIPAAAALTFDVELLAVELPFSDVQGTFAADNLETPRTPEAIKAAFQAKLAAKEAPKEGLQGTIDWVKSWYIFGLFSTDGEKPPILLNPLITFPSIFAVVGALFYLTVALNGLHRGDVPAVGDDLSEFIGDPPVPFDVQ